MAQSFKDDQQNVTLTYRLSKSAGMLLTILQPDKAPAADAEVYIIPFPQNFSLEQSERFDNSVAFGGGQHLQRSDDTGHLTVAVSSDSTTRIVILHDSGFANLLLSDAAKSPIHLDPWASVDGTARIGKELLANQTVTLDYSPDDHPGSPYIGGTFNATTDADGHFSFDQVPPGHAVIGRWLEINPGIPYAVGTIANPRHSALSPGPNHIDIGGTGRLLTGRIVNPDHSPLHAGISFMGNFFTSTSVIYPKPPVTLLQKDRAIYKLPPDQMKAEMLKLQSSPEFVAYQRQIDEYNTASRQVTAIYFAIAPDGAFRIDDVPPGTYTLTTTIFNLKSNTALGTLKKSLLVPRSDVPLDLGDLPLTLPKPAASAARSAD